MTRNARTARTATAPATHESDVTDAIATVVATTGTEPTTDVVASIVDDAAFGIDIPAAMESAGTDAAAWVALYAAVPSSGCATVRAGLDAAIMAAMSAATDMDGFAVAKSLTAARGELARPGSAAPVVVRTGAEYAAVVAARVAYARYATSAVPADMPESVRAEFDAAYADAATAAYAMDVDALRSVVGESVAAGIDAVIGRSAFGGKSAKTSTRAFIVGALTESAAPVGTWIRVREITRGTDKSDGAVGAYIASVIDGRADVIPGVSVRNSGGPGVPAGFRIDDRDALTA